MNGRTVALKGLLVSMSWFVTAEYPPPTEGGGEVNDACFVDLGPRNCALQNAGCLQLGECFGKETRWTGVSSNWLEQPVLGGYLGDFVYEEICYREAPCIQMGGGTCGPDLTKMKEEKFTSGHINWDMPCPTVPEW